MNKLQPLQQVSEPIQVPLATAQARGGLKRIGRPLREIQGEGKYVVWSDKKLATEFEKTRRKNEKRAMTWIVVPFLLSALAVLAVGLLAAATIALAVTVLSINALTLVGLGASSGLKAACTFGGLAIGVAALTKGLPKLISFAGRKKWLPTEEAVFNTIDNFIGFFDRNHKRDVAEFKLMEVERERRNLQAMKAGEDARLRRAQRLEALIQSLVENKNTVDEAGQSAALAKAPEYQAKFEAERKAAESAVYAALAEINAGVMQNIYTPADLQRALTVLNPQPKEP